MSRSLSSDLRSRVISAIEEGVSTREAARRFRIGISTAGNWYRRYRQTGETVARKQGQPSRSKLDRHEGFILGLIDAAPDITLAEIAERLMSEHGVRAVASTIWMFLDKRAITFKNVWPAPLARRTVGAHFGLTPRRFQSGEKDNPGHISHAGDADVRATLYAAANAMLMRSIAWSSLKAWGMRLMKTKGRRRAIVAVARKIAVVLHRMWIDDTPFRFRSEATA